MAHLAASLASSTAFVYGAALLAAAVQYRLECRAQQQAACWAGLWRYLLPPELIRSRWTQLDALLLILHSLFGPFLLRTAFAVTIAAALGTGHFISRRLPAGHILGGGYPAAFGFAAVGILLSDFCSFYWHYMTHRFPLLWEFHKAHHARETLCPLAARSVHPVEEFLGALVEGLPLGLAAGLYGALSGVTADSLFGIVIETTTVANILALSPLKHSHIELRFGPLERILLSPAHHQLHHSLETPHLDKNFGAIFPFWDGIWNTLHEPPDGATYRLGLHGREGCEYATLKGFYLTPLRRIFRTRCPAAPPATP